MNIIGKNVRLTRERNGWTQEQLAAKCNLVDWEISRATLAKIESNVRRITDIEVKKLSIALNISIEELFKTDENPE